MAELLPKHLKRTCLNVLVYFWYSAKSINAQSFSGAAASPNWIMTQMLDFNPQIVCQTLLLSTGEVVVQLCCFAFKIKAHRLIPLHFLSRLFRFQPWWMYLMITTVKIIALCFFTFVAHDLSNTFIVRLDLLWSLWRRQPFNPFIIFPNRLVTSNLTLHTHTSTNTHKRVLWIEYILSYFMHLCWCVYCSDRLPRYSFFCCSLK